jgi:tetratricopeptide (TPR) repeat protein
MESQVAQSLRDARAAVLADPGSAAAWGRFGMVHHAHELWDEARAAYQEARRLDPEDERWPYYLGDVLSVVGTDPQAAALALRDALSLRGDYAPAHMRLGKVLLAAGEDAAAAVELARALELEGELQPARLALAQIRLSQGDLELAAAMLEQILEQQPRHAQALSTLGQTYMRQGRRDAARQIAERARSAAIYNLYSDPLMSLVVAEGVSSVLIWERAKAFFDNGNYEQASRGLRQVVALQPSNVDAHHQLATAYGNLGELNGARRHLERTLALRPDGVEARIQLATVHLDQQHPAAAISVLRRVLELAPEDPDAGWLLARAMVEAGDPGAGLRQFEGIAQGGLEVPGWAQDAWGRALAQSGRPEEALKHFRLALEQDPEDAQALFFIGLVFEGYGRIDEAVRYYCRSTAAVPNPPSAARLQALGLGCD